MTISSQNRAGACGYANGFTLKLNLSTDLWSVCAYSLSRRVAEYFDIIGQYFEVFDDDWMQFFKLVSLLR